METDHGPQKYPLPLVQRQRPGGGNLLRRDLPPRVLTEAYSNPDPAVAKRAFEAMMTMRKIDIATLERAAASA